MARLAPRANTVPSARLQLPKTHFAQATTFSGRIVSERDCVRYANDAKLIVVRNVFDQYDTPENRLSHALATCLHEDAAFLDSFITWSGVSTRPKRSRIDVVSQRIPMTIADPRTERRGLPDIWLYDEDGWCLLIESKIEAELTVDQLARHVRTAERAGFTTPSLLTLTVNSPCIPLRPGWFCRRWSELYALASRHLGWPRRLAEYMEIAETRLPEEKYMKTGTLTAFDGIRFDAEHPYSYLQGKRLLGLLMSELRARTDLLALGMNASGEGRPAITDSGTYVWDFIPLHGAGGEDAFTKHPHLTVGLHADHVNAMITLPNGVRRDIRKHLVELGEGGFRGVVAECGARLTAALRDAAGAKPQLYLSQRHYPSQRSQPILDGKIEFDLRTLVADPTSGVKVQAEWTSAAFNLLANRDSNMQLGIGAIFPSVSPAMRSKRAVDYVAATWLACEPWLRVGLGIARI